MKQVLFKVAYSLLVSLLNAVLLVWTIRTLFLVDLDYSIATLGAAAYLTLFFYYLRYGGTQ